MSIDAAVITDPSVLDLASLHVRSRGNVWNRKKEPWEKNRYGIPIDQPVGTRALWYRKNPAGGYLGPDVKAYYGKTVKSVKINETDPLASFTKDGHKPTYLLEVVEFKKK